MRGRGQNPRGDEAREGVEHERGRKSRGAERKMVRNLRWDEALGDRTEEGAQCERGRNARGGEIREGGGTRDGTKS